MKKSRLLGLVCSVLLFVSIPAANSADWVQLDADAIINNCWQISEEERDSGITNRIRNGTINSATCIRKQIVNNASTLFHDSTYSKEDIDQHMELLNEGIGKFYWNLNNENIDCNGPSGCGTIYHVFHANKIARVYEKILRDVISKRNELEM